MVNIEQLTKIRFPARHVKIKNVNVRILLLGRSFVQSNHTQNRLINYILIKGRWWTKYKPTRPIYLEFSSSSCLLTKKTTDCFCFFIETKTKHNKTKKLWSIGSLINEQFFYIETNQKKWKNEIPKIILVN